jgi:hypothetical protein
MELVLSQVTLSYKIKNKTGILNHVE